MSSQNKIHRVVRVKVSVVAVILAVLFGMLAVLISVVVQLQQQNYEICRGSSRQIERVVDRLTAPAPIPPDASPAQRATLEDRNRRSEESHANIQAGLRDSLRDCNKLR